MQEVPTRRRYRQCRARPTTSSPLWPRGVKRRTCRCRLAQSSPSPSLLISTGALDWDQFGDAHRAELDEITSRGLDDILAELADTLIDRDVCCSSPARAPNTHARVLRWVESVLSRDWAGQRRYSPQ